MIDEALLDTPDELLRTDRHGLLRGVAAAGAHLRTAARAAEESELSRLRPEGRPGTLLMAGAGPEVPLAAGLLAALAGDGTRVTRLRPTGPLPAPGALSWPLPRWAGPLDLLLITSAEGTEPGLTALLEAAFRRGCAVVTVAPAGSPLAEATRHRRNLTMPFALAPHQEPGGHPAAPGPGWALITPLLLLGDRLGLFDAGPEAVRAMADRLDSVAEQCGPAIRTHDNAAKALAAGCASSLPLLWSEGPLARAVAEHAARVLRGLPGCPALAAELPGAMTAHGPLLNGPLAAGGDPDDFFRDRVEEPAPLNARILLLRGPRPGGPEDPGGANGSASSAGSAGSAVTAVRDLAFAHSVAFDELTAAADSGPLETVAELIARFDFAAVYLTLASGARP